MGAFIVIEGGDGSGKATQALELETHALQKGYNVLRVSFPNYDAPSARFIVHYLNGKFGPARDVHPELASMLYAIDRYAVSEKIKTHLQKPHALVIADRYVASNLAHQGTKFTRKAERLKFYQNILEVEYGVLDLPKPDLNVVLLVPTVVAQANVNRKPSRSYTSEKRDEHEKDAEHLQRANTNYAELTELYPDDYVAISCMEPDDKNMRSVADISEDIWQTVQPLLYDRA